MFGGWTWNIQNIQKLDIDVFYRGLHCRCHPDHVCAHCLLFLNWWTEFSKVTRRCCVLNCRRSRFAVGYSGIWQLLGEEGQLLSKGRESRMTAAAVVGFGGRRRRWEKAEGGNGSSWNLDPALRSCRSCDYCGWIYMRCVLLTAQVSHSWLSSCVLQTPILLTPSPLLSSIHFWSTLSPVAPLSPARLQGANTLFQVSSGKFSQSLCFSVPSSGDLQESVSPNIWCRNKIAIFLFSIPCVSFWEHLILVFTQFYWSVL